MTAHPPADAVDLGGKLLISKSVKVIGKGAVWHSLSPFSRPLQLYRYLAPFLRYNSEILVDNRLIFYSHLYLTPTYRDDPVRIS